MDKWARREDYLILASSALILALAFALPAPPDQAPGISLLGTPLNHTCVLKTISGIDCPLCGITRSMVCLGHGRLGSAIAFHPLGPALMIFVIAQVIYRGLRLASARFARLSAGVSGAVRGAPTMLLLTAFLVAWVVKLAQTAMELW